MTSIWPAEAPILIVGCGNMAGAMLKRWLDVGMSADAVTVVRPSGVAPVPGVRTLTALPDGAKARLLLLGVKPQKLPEVAPDVARALGPDTLLLSILAGTELATLRERLGHAGAIVRAMPNMPVAIGRGAVALHGDPGPFRAELERLMSPLGTWEWIGDETLFHALTALVGSGPAFVFRYVEALAEAAADLGLPRDQALRLARAMVDGAAGLLSVSPEHPRALAEQVASPGGTTRAGLDVLDGGLPALVRATLQAAAQRSRELAG
jgi:pyrroline-5-carboxylate reductase